MNTMIKRLLFLFLLSYTAVAAAQIKINHRQQSAADFPLFANGKSCELFIDSSDAEVVKKVAALFAEDIERVTGVKGTVSVSESAEKIKGKEVVVIGTLGHNGFIDNLVRQNYQ